MPDHSPHYSDTCDCRSCGSVRNETLECIQEGDGKCSGNVEYRMALSGTGISFPRCDKHWEARLDAHERDSAIYPDSPIAPDWFDPTACGEVWDSEDY